MRSRTWCGTRSPRSDDSGGLGAAQTIARFTALALVLLCLGGPALLLGGRHGAARRPNDVARRPRCFARSLSRDARLDGRRPVPRPSGSGSRGWCASSRCARSSARRSGRRGPRVSSSRSGWPGSRRSRSPVALTGRAAALGASRRRRRARGHLPALGPRARRRPLRDHERRDPRGGCRRLGGWARDPRPLSRHHRDRRSIYAGSVPSFSAVAITAVAVLLATGIVNALVELPELAALWESTYGRLVLAKSALLVVLVAAGAFQRRLACHGYGARSSGSRAPLSACRRGGARS